MATDVSYEPPASIRTHKKRAWLKAFANGPRCAGLVVRTCAVIGIHHKTYYDWLATDPDFAAEQETAKEYAIESLESRLDAAALDEEEPNITAAIFRLKGLRPEVYRERHEIKVGHEEVNRAIEAELQLRAKALQVSTNGESNGHAV
jgi:hypothetical protein